MDRLLAHGHQRIGFFTHHYDVEASWALRRHSAYMEKLFSLGMPYHPEDALNIGLHNKLGYDDTHQRALDLTRQGVTAWLCASDYEAYQLIEFFKKNGLSVPRDVAVTGFDGIRKPSGAPLLSTVQIPYREIGVTGVKRLFDMIHRRFDSPQHILLDCALREGETVTAARKRAL